MQPDLDIAVLAVDGGGTNCRLALEAGDERHTVLLGPANVSTDMDLAATTIRNGLERMAAECGVDYAALCRVPAYLGLAGVVDAEYGARVGEELPLERVIVDDDRRPAVRGALDAEDGSVAGIGTGSFLARQRGGQIRLAGGWGSRLGDEASGFWLAKTALVQTLDVADGIREDTGLTRSLMDRFGGKPRGIVHFSISATPKEVAALAPAVVEAAEVGDAVGREVLMRGAAYIRDMFAAIGWRKGEPICFLGGLSAAYRDYLPKAMQAAIQPPKGTALDGALALARQMAAQGGGRA